MKPLHWPQGVPRFVVRRADDRRFFVYDLFRERRCTLLTVCEHEARRAVVQCEKAATRDRLA